MEDNDATTNQLSKSRSRCLSGDDSFVDVIQKSGLSPGLVDLVNYRASQINGRAFCLDMHSKDLRAWRDRATYLHALLHALSLACGSESLLCSRARGSCLGRSRKAQLTLGVVAINGWNRQCRVSHARWQLQVRGQAICGLEGAMSASGQERTPQCFSAMSASTLKADICNTPALTCTALPSSSPARSFRP
jgi:AhpD family alkylhydroperoxidase